MPIKNQAKDRVMVSIKNSITDFNTFISGLQMEFAERVRQRIEAQLEADVERWLHRGYHERRVQVGQRQSQATCQRCGTRQARRFSRNGHRRRQLVTQFGVLDAWVPRVRCECGGSVAIPFSILRPYQRLWDDVVAQIGRWAELGLSLRQMQDLIGEQAHTQVGLRKLNEVVQQVSQPLDLQLRSVPPVIQLDAIWVTLLEPARETRLDRLGRQRTVKARDKVCILVALGLYPQTGRWGIVAWSLAENESQDAWEQLLVPLETRGLYRERGVELFIHDGGAGLIATLNSMYPQIPHQRCLFHKLRNLGSAIRAPESLSRTEVQAFKRDLRQQLHAIFWASSPDEACRLRDEFSRQWHATQPELVALLWRDWPDTIAFFQILARFPTWPRRYLRTTSLLERVNRMIRRLFRSAGAFHSALGLLAAVARVLLPLRLI
jgi:transposase-like protein